MHKLSLGEKLLTSRGVVGGIIWFLKNCHLFLTWNMFSLPCMWNKSVLDYICGIPWWQTGTLLQGYIACLFHILEVVIQWACPLHSPGSTHIECSLCCPGGSNSSRGLYVWEALLDYSCQPSYLTINSSFTADSRANILIQLLITSRIVSEPHDNVCYFLKGQPLTSEVIEKLKI